MSNYIMDLRKIVGHRTLIQCAASIICIKRIITNGDMPADLLKLTKRWKMPQKGSCLKKPA